MHAVRYCVAFIVSVLWWMRHNKHNKPIWNPCIKVDLFLFRYEQFRLSIFILFFKFDFLVVSFIYDTFKLFVISCSLCDVNFAVVYCQWFILLYFSCIHSAFVVAWRPIRRTNFAYTIGHSIVSVSSMECKYGAILKLLSFWMRSLLNDETDRPWSFMVEPLLLQPCEIKSLRDTFHFE